MGTAKRIGIKWWEKIALRFCQPQMGFHYQDNGDWTTTVLKHFNGRVYVMSVNTVVYKKQEATDEAHK